MTVDLPRLYKNVLRFLVCFSVFIFFPFSSSAISFNVPEKLIYDLTWKGIKAGEASFEIKEDGDKIRILSTVKSAEWVSAFYKVDNRTESILTKNNIKGNENNPFLLGQPLNYRLKTREGRHRRDKEIIFNHSNKKATHINYITGEMTEIDLPANTFDPLSGFYHLRTLPLEVGRSTYVTIFDSKRVWNVEVQILMKGRLKLPSGVFNTILVKPLMKSEGIFRRKGDILIWLTDDEKRIPVKVQTKVVIGSVVATLVGGVY